MPDREPEPWESAAPGPLMQIGDVGLHALGEDHFKIAAPGHEEVVHGFEYAGERARMLASQRE